MGTIPVGESPSFQEEEARGWVSKEELALKMSLLEAASTLVSGGLCRGLRGG